MFCLLERWLFTKAMSIELVKRFPNKTPFKCAWQVGNDLHKLPILQQSAWIPHQKLERQAVSRRYPQKVEKCLTKILEKLSNT